MADLHNPSVGWTQQMRSGVWTLWVYPEVESTNILASKLPPWAAIRAERQTGGRGRHGRKWESSAGGLWLSLVIPAPELREQWEALPLTTGWVVMEMLTELGIPSLRLRWPNDVMVKNQKLCGLLVERFSPQTAVIGIGLNVFNHPEQEDAALKGLTARLENFLPSPPDLNSLALNLCSRVQAMQETIATQGWNVYREKINRAWDKNRRVECLLGENVARGFFQGVDEAGNLILKDDANAELTLNASQVSLLREV
ncbi:MAG: biotin--[acetyl-CoA-carboxylase] ligase [bacterium]